MSLNFCGGPNGAPRSQSEHGLEGGHPWGGVPRMTPEALGELSVEKELGEVER
jgi:hypothetical protein